MSISFSPSQTAAIQACLSVSEALEYEECTYLPRVYHDLRRAFVFSDTHGYWQKLDAYTLTGKDASSLQDAIDEDLTSNIELTVRAWYRFRNEFASYTGGRRNLASVRKYHKLLVDTLVPFKSILEGF